MVSATEQAKSKATFELKERVYLFADAYKAFLGTSPNLTSAARNAMREALGGKGAGLAEMTASGVNVPPGLTIITSCCREYSEHGQKMPKGLFDEVLLQLRHVEAAVDRKLGDVNKPLLVSVRSGAKFSMPGMMDTVLNLGLNDATVEGLAKMTNNARFAWDSYRRFIQMYSNVVLEINKDKFEDILEDMKDNLGSRTTPT